MFGVNVAPGLVGRAGGWPPGRSRCEEGPVFGVKVAPVLVGRAEVPLLARSGCEEGPMFGVKVAPVLVGGPAVASRAADGRGVVSAGCSIRSAFWRSLPL